MAITLFIKILAVAMLVFKTNNIRNVVSYAFIDVYAMVCSHNLFLRTSSLRDSLFMP